MTTSVDIANRALAQIGTRSQITALNDAAVTESLYAGLLYAPLRDFLLREGDYDFSLQNAAVSGYVAGIVPWVHTYANPSGALRIRQMIPVSYSALDPRPVLWNVINVSGVLRIAALEPMQRVIYTAIPASEDLWDAIFTEAYTRLLASALAFALENRIEASDAKLKEAISFAGIANLRDS